MMAGVIEGFYGPPWSRAERFRLFDWMQEWGLNTYFYAPKDDAKHRISWAKRYSESEAGELEELIRECHRRGLRFIYGLAPGLNIFYSDYNELHTLGLKFEQLKALGCSHFALLFDDIPDQMHAQDQERFASFALAQCYVANKMEREIGGHFMFCPTPYCGRMAKSKLGGEGYLETIGRELAPQIEIFWTGPEIISETITVEHAREMAGIFRRKPVIWDNLHANDYDGRRFFCGPYQGRALELKSEVNGILLNPNCEFPLNYAPLRTFGKFAQSEGGYDPRSEYVAAMTEWNRGMETFTGHVPLAGLLMLGDCYYLPFEEGPLAEKLIAAVENLNAQELELMRCFCSDLAQLKDRALFAALHRRVWELREELDLLEKFARNGGKATFSDFHLPKTYRGGVIPRLQRLLKQNEDGSFSRA